MDILSLYQEYNGFHNAKDKRELIINPRERKKTVLFHYTRLNNFYNIIKTDGLWATHARFSNDDEELRYIDKEIPKDKEINIPEEYYIVSLCDDDDLLSQWRGYCGEDEGVAIGFDLGIVQYFYLHSKLQEKQPDSSPFFNIANKVFYEYKEVSDYYEQFVKEGDYNIAYKMLKPYAKHPKFREEREYRLAVVNVDGQFDNYIRYRPSAGRETPFIEIKFGNPKNNICSCNIRLNIKKDVEDKLFDVLDDGIKYRIIKCRKSTDTLRYGRHNDSNCYGCSMKRYVMGDYCNYGDDYVSIDISKNIIHISEGNDQKDVFLKVSQIVDEINRNTKEIDKITIWCEGHLPIRKICVGNTRRKDELKESIKHYCQHNNEQYWLKYVEIANSDIPYRTPLNFN